MMEGIYWFFFLKTSAVQFSPSTFYACVIITLANSKDGHPYGGPNMVAPWCTSIFLIEQWNKG